VRLIGESRVARHLDQRALLMIPLPREVETAHEHAGVLKGLPCLFGVTTGMGLMMFLVPLGLGSLVLEHPLHHMGLVIS
jgi:hypothetical protein